MFETFELPKTRTYIGDAIKKVWSRFREGKKNTSVNIPPRSGKSNIQYAVSVEASERDLTPFALSLSPWVFLDKQLRSNAKKNSHAEIYKLKSLFRTNKPASFLDVDWFETTNRVHLWSTTIQHAYCNIEFLRESVKKAIETYQCRPIIHIDEAHYFQQLSGSWDALYKMFLDSGAYCVVYTGTPLRSDKKKISGIEYEDDDPQESKRVTSRIGSVRQEEGRKVAWQTVTVQNGMLTKSRARPTINIPWRRAWQDGALLKVDCRWVTYEVDMFSEERGRENAVKKRLDELTSKEVKRHLRRIVESKEAITKTCHVTVDRLAEYKRYYPKAAAMVVVGTDVNLDGEEKQVNRHARAVRDQLLKECEGRGLRWQIEIATKAREDGTGCEKLKNFHNGMYDILIVKMMGLVGLDMPRLCVLSHLSTQRDGPTMGQLLTRPLTPCTDLMKIVSEKGVGELFYPATIIMQKDVLSVQQYQLWINSNGGTAKQFTITDENSHLKKIELNKHLCEVTNGQFAGHSDHEGVMIDNDYSEKLSAARWQWPMLRVLTDIELVKMLESDSLVVDLESYRKSNKPTIIDEEELVMEKRKKINELCKQLSNKRFSYANEQRAWIEERKRWMSLAKHEARIVASLDAETDPCVLDIAIDFLETELNDDV